MSLSPEIRRLEVEIQTSLRWIDKMQREIWQEGHAGWGNTLDDIAATLDKLNSFLLARGEPPPTEALLSLVEDFAGWWHLNREGSVNRTYARIDTFVEAVNQLPAAPPPVDPQPRGSRCGKCGQPCAHCATGTNWTPLRASPAGHPPTEAQKDEP
jgi:hypothetical protein